MLVINDFSEDDTFEKGKELFSSDNKFRILNNKKRPWGSYQSSIVEAKGINIAIMMADQSDDIKDLVKYNELISKNEYDAILGSRFLKQSKISNYPFQKLILNRIFNYFVSLIFWNNYNDYTNAFKIYKKKV